MEVNEASASYLPKKITSCALGYKQTEVGVIPEDWSCTTVGQLVRDGVLEKPLDGNHGNIHPKSGDFVSFGIPFVMANNVQGGRVDLNNCVFIRKEQADSLQKGFSKPGDVLLTHKATIGNTAVVGDIPFEYIMLTPQVTYYRVADRSRLSNLYLRQFFDSTSFQSVLISMSGGGTRAYIGITAQLQLPVVLPPTKAEQEAIAEALSDADALIESISLLLAKKRHLKQGAMQELLTGKKRLPGFSGEWEMKRLGDISPLQRGFDLPTTQIRLGRYPVVYSNGVLNYHDQFMVKGSGVVTGRSGTIGNVHFVEDDFWPHNTSLWVTSFKGNSPRFIYYLLTYIGLERFGTGSGVPTLNRNDVHAHKALIPPTTEEQTAIATILSDMDAEIAALEAKLTKARNLKQGMMQELLTGRIRLV
jgi:type I restriction enzyme, S subunit